MAMEHTNDSLFIGAQHIRLKRVNSTNAYAIDMISKSKPIEGTVISASFQYEGRGQIGRFWESEDNKNILCSTILKPTFIKAADQFYLNIAVSLALHDFIDHFIASPTHKISIKWPNDIYIDSNKVAGILIQNTLKGKYVTSSVIGTGININQVDFSEDIPNPTSLKIEKNTDFDLDNSFLWLFRFLTKRYLQLSAGHFVQMKEEYESHLYQKDEWHNYYLPDKSILVGKIITVDDSGYLIIKQKNGALLKFAFREIAFR